MSLAIDVDHVTAVLIHGTWYTVLDDSFALDSYEYIWWERGPDTRNQWGGDVDPELLHGGGHNGICATGFAFRTTDTNAADSYRMCGPLTSITAVKTRT